MSSYDVSKATGEANGGEGRIRFNSTSSGGGGAGGEDSTNNLNKSASKTSRPMLEHQQSTASMRRRNYQRRRSSTFDFVHIDSTAALPSEKLDELDLDAEQEFKNVPWWTSQRFRLAILCFLGFVVLYAQRVNLSIAVVSMVKDHGKRVNGSTTIDDFMLMINRTNSTDYYANTTVAPKYEDQALCPELPASEIRAEFDWDKELTGLILGGFFWGYLVLQVPGGRLSETFGAKRVIAISMFPVAILNILSPVVARANPYAFLILRVFVGLGEGVMYPAAQALWSKWAPPNERSRLIGFSYAGGQFGNAIIFPIGGFLCAYGFDGGWPSVFYVIGGAGFLWCVAWVIFASDSPDDCKSITELEKKYIKYSIGDRSKPHQHKSTPWRKIFTSSAVWAILVAHTCGNYGAYMLLTKIPAYMKEVLKFDIKSNGVFSMLPYLTFWFFITLSAMIADFLISREILSVANTRKLMAAIGMIGPASALIGTGFMECHQQAGAVALLTIAVGLCGFHFSGYFINHGDICPPFAGTLFGISNTMATIPGIFSPYIVAAMTPNGTAEEWRATFYIAAAIYTFGAIWYAIFGKGEVLPWVKGKDDEDKPENVGFGLTELQQVHEEDEEEEEGERTRGLLGKSEKPKEPVA